MGLQTNSIHSFALKSPARNGHASAEAVRTRPDFHFGIQGGFKPVQMLQFDIRDAFRHIESVFRKVVGKVWKVGAANGFVAGKRGPVGIVGATSAIATEIRSSGQIDSVQRQQHGNTAKFRHEIFYP
jgi:hypothetical protein